MLYRLIVCDMVLWLGFPFDCTDHSCFICVEWPYYLHIQEVSLLLENNRPASTVFQMLSTYCTLEPDYVSVIGIMHLHIEWRVMCVLKCQYVSYLPSTRMGGVCEGRGRMSGLA